MKTEKEIKRELAAARFYQTKLSAYIAARIDTLEWVLETKEIKKRASDL